MSSDIQEIYQNILKDPELFESLVLAYIEEHPNTSIEEIHIFILQIIAKQLAEEADQEKARRQLDIARDRIISKALERLPDSDSDSSSVNKSKIKSAIARISNSGVSADREKAADLLKDYSETQERRIKRRQEASDDIEERK